MKISQIRTSLIDSGKNREMKIYVSNGNLTMHSNTTLMVESIAGPSSMISKYDLKIRSINGSLTLESVGGIYLRNLKVPNFEVETKFKPALIELNEKDVYQVCVCENGKLFMVPPRDVCSIQSNSDCF